MKRLNLFTKIFLILLAVTTVSGTLAAAFTQIAQRTDPKFVENSIDQINNRISKSKDYSEVREEDLTNIHTLEFRSIAADISIETYTGSTLKIEYAGKVPDEKGTPNLIDLQTRGDVTSVDFLVPQSNQSSVVVFQWNDSTRGINLGGKTDLKARVLVPRAFQGNMLIKSTAGDISLTNALLTDLSIANISGDISLNHSQLQNVLARSVSGDIEAENCDAKDWKVSSTSGEVEIELSHIEGAQLNLSSVSGLIYADPLIQTKSKKIVRVLNVKTISGDIKVSPYMND